MGVYRYSNTSTQLYIGGMYIPQAYVTEYSDAEVSGYTEYPEMLIDSKDIYFLHLVKVNSKDWRTIFSSKLEYSAVTPVTDMKELYRFVFKVVEGNKERLLELNTKARLEIK